MTARSKPRAWKKWLGFTVEDAHKVQEQVMARLADFPANPKTPTDIHGQRFNVYVPITGPNSKTVDVKKAWIYQRKTDGTVVSPYPRLTTIYVSKKSHAV